MSETQSSSSQVHAISVVVPVYKGETTLPGLVAELAPMATSVGTTPDGAQFTLDQVFLVWDCGPDASDETIRRLAGEYPFVRPIWLSRNFGQHPATMAGMASAGGDWIVTMDEDGQQDPADIPALLDAALRNRATVVYGKPVNPPPHGAFRNWASRTAKSILNSVMDGGQASEFNSYRLVLGETGRALAAYAGPGVYLDVALSWISRRTITCPVTVRSEDRPSGYTLRSLVSHFVRMLVTSGTKGLRAVTITGLLVGLAGLLLSLFLVVSAVVRPLPVPGWTSMMCVMLVSSGLIIASLGIVAEYIGVTVNAAMGKPLYLIVSDPANGPLGRRRPAGDESGRK